MEKDLNSKVRINFLDSLRGIAIINMVLYHLTYDLYYIFNVNISWFTGNSAYIWQQFICWTFILVSGATCHFGKKGIYRAVFIISLGTLIMTVTRYIMPSEMIVFGILSFMGSAMIIVYGLKKYLLKINKYFGFLVSFTLFAITKGIPEGFLGFFDIPITYLPKSFYENKMLFMFGFPTKDFYSSDYFPILPWIFLYLSGFFGFKIIENFLKTSKVLNIKIPFINFIGRHSIEIYILHQPIVYGILFLIFK